MRLILIRHGQSMTNVSGVISTLEPGPALTGHGELQAQSLIDALDHENITRIACSGLARAQLTSRPLAQHLGIEPAVVAGLEEISAGDLEGSASHEHHAQYEAVLRSWFAGDLKRRLPGSTDGHAFLRRFNTALEHLAALHAGDPGAAAVFSHAAAIRAFLALRLAVEDRPIDNTGFAVLEGDPSHWRLAAWSGDPAGGPGLRSMGNYDLAAEPNLGPQ